MVENFPQGMVVKTAISQYIEIRNDSFFPDHSSILIFKFFILVPVDKLYPLYLKLYFYALFSYFSSPDMAPWGHKSCPSLIFSFSSSQHRSAHTERPLCYGAKPPGHGDSHLLPILALLLTKEFWVDHLPSPHLSFFFHKLEMNNAIFERNAMKIKFINSLVHSIFTAFWYLSRTMVNIANTYMCISSTFEEFMILWEKMF